MEDIFSLSPLSIYDIVHKEKKNPSRTELAKNLSWSGDLMVVEEFSFVVSSNQLEYELFSNMLPSLSIEKYYMGVGGKHWYWC